MGSATVLHNINLVRKSCMWHIVLAHCIDPWAMIDHDITCLMVSCTISSRPRPGPMIMTLKRGSQCWMAPKLLSRICFFRSSLICMLVCVSGTAD